MKHEVLEIIAIVDQDKGIRAALLMRQAKLQSKLLENVSQLLKPNGRIVYSTCSIDRVENEEVVEASGLTVESTSVSHPWEHGFDGAFAALLRK